jgi:hypothetical protein
MWRGDRDGDAGKGGVEEEEEEMFMMMFPAAPSLCYDLPSLPNNSDDDDDVLYALTCLAFLGTFYMLEHLKKSSARFPNGRWLKRYLIEVPAIYVHRLLRLR